MEPIARLVLLNVLEKVSDLTNIMSDESDVFRSIFDRGPEVIGKFQALAEISR